MESKSGAASQTVLVAIAGGSASGKTTLARALAHSFGAEEALILSQDHYYFDQSLKVVKEGEGANFDHPSAIDFELLREHLLGLQAGNAVSVPRYDFATHSRQKEVDHYSPRSIVFVDGTLVLASDIVRNVFDVKIFVQTEEDLRFQRRQERDVRERGRTPEGVERQFTNQVKPMHDIFVEPSKHHADLVVSGAVPVASIIVKCLHLIDTKR